MEEHGTAQQSGPDAWNKVLEISRTMLSHARDDAWFLVADLEEKRREQLSSVFAREVEQTGAQSFADNIKALLEIDSEIIRLAEVRRKHIGGQLRGIHKANEVRDVYTSYQGIHRNI